MLEQVLRRSFSSVVLKPPSYKNLPAAWSVIGGAGMLGKSLVDHLIESGAESVKVLDLKPYAGRYANDPRICSVIGSVSDRTKLNEVMAGVNVAVAAITPHISSAPWSQFVSVNVHGTQSALNAAVQSGCVKSFVAVSSIAVHNHYIEHKNTKETDPLPKLGDYRSPYDLTKRLAEDLVIQADDKSGMRTVALRPGGILMGPGDYAPEGIFKNGISYMEGKPIDFSYGRNICHAIVLGACSLIDPVRRESVGGRAFHVSKGKATTIGQVARDIGLRMKKPIKVLPGAVLSAVSLGSRISHALINDRRPHLAPGIPTHRFLGMANFGQTFDNTLAKTVLGFEPLYSYEETLDIIVEEYLAGIHR